MAGGAHEDAGEAGGRFRRRLAAVPSSVPILRRELTSWAKDAGVGDEPLQAVRLAVSEAVTNAVVHAFIAIEPGTVQLVAVTGPDVLEVRVIDDGTGMGPRPDSPGLGMGVPMIGKLCSTVDLGEGPDGTGTEVRMVFAVPGLRAPHEAPHGDVDEVLRALAELSVGEGFGGGDIGMLAPLLVPRIADLCSVVLLEADGTARRVGAAVARPDGSPDAESTAWVMAFPLNTSTAPSYRAAADNRASVVPVDEAFANAVSPDAESAQRLLGLGLSWWAAIPLRSGDRAVGSIAVSGRQGDPDAAVAAVERIAAHAGGLVATARLVGDLRRTQRRLAQVLGALAEAVTVTDPDGRIVFANAAAARLLGLPSPEALVQAAPGAIRARFRVTDADGRPVRADELPYRRLFREGHADPLLTRSVELASGRTLWLRTTATLLDDGDLAVNVIQDVTAETEAVTRRQLLAQVGETLDQALGRPDAFELIARLSVPALADGCILDLLRDDGTLEHRLVEHTDPARAQAIQATRRRHPPVLALPFGAGRVLTEGRPDVLNDVTDELLQLGAQDDGHLAELRALGMRSVATLPVMLHGRVLGLLTLVNDVSGRAFTPEDLAFATDLAGRTAVAIDNARLQTEREQAVDDLEETLRRLRLLADAGFGGLIRGVEDRITEANDTFLRMVGYDSVQDMPPWPQMTPPEWAAVDAEVVAQMRAGETPDLFEKEYLRKDGTPVRVLIGAAVADPATFEWICVVVDVSGRRASSALQDAGLDGLGTTDGVQVAGRPGADVAAVVGGMAAAILIQRPAAGIVYANQAAAVAMGMASPQAVMAATPEQIAAGWEAFDEHGVPLAADRYPSRRLLQGERSVPPLTVRAVNRATGREYWRVVRAIPVFDAAGSLDMTVSMTEDVTEMRRAMLTQRLFAEAGEILSSSTDYRRTLRRLADVLVPELADWCSIAMADEHGVIRQVAAAHVDPEKVRFAEEYDRRYAQTIDAEGGSAEILRGGPATLIPDIPDELLREAIADPEQLEHLRLVGMRSVIQVPLAPTEGSPIGVLSLVNAESGRVFAAADLAICEELGRRAGTAVQNARLHRERAHIAATLQASLLPDELPEVPGFAVAAMYRPAGEQNWVGGDFYDAFAVPGGWMVIVGDVAGHGAAAAALTAQARHTLRAIGEAFGDPVRAVAHLNRLLVPRLEQALCTVCVILLRTADDGGATASVTCAGHPLPYLVRGGVPHPVGEWGPLLGAWESEFTSVDVPLEDEDVLVVYTDGVLDARGGGTRFGQTRLEEALAPARGAGDAVNRVQGALEAFETGEQADDTAVIAIGRRPA